ncbi:unnamed protein product [Cuscuta campestris]|uniref:Uncharacterized protein n=1 Tax=Cuscuta campestris TaxID=132261 RepID=A0A484MJZ2_9ASTE|nr:unnamed protein product [Cuscuta campestris]
MLRALPLLIPQHPAGETSPEIASSMIIPFSIEQPEPEDDTCLLLRPLELEGGVEIVAAAAENQERVEDEEEEE